MWRGFLGRGAAASPRLFPGLLDCCRCFDDEGPDEQEDSRDDERYRQQLTHIQCHSLFEADLRFLDEFDQEAHSEAAYEEESEEEEDENASDAGTDEVGNHYRSPNSYGRDDHVDSKYEDGYNKNRSHKNKRKKNKHKKHNVIPMDSEY